VSRFFRGASIGAAVAGKRYTRVKTGSGIFDRTVKKQRPSTRDFSQAEAGKSCRWRFDDRATPARAQVAGTGKVECRSNSTRQPPRDGKRAIGLSFLDPTPATAATRIDDGRFRTPNEPLVVRFAFTASFRRTMRLDSKENDAAFPFGNPRQSPGLCDDFRSE
jgi:hypothetical protein